MPILNEAEIAPDSATVTQSVNNVLNNLINDYPNLPKVLIDFFDSADFVQD